MDTVNDRVSGPSPDAGGNLGVRIRLADAVGIGLAGLLTVGLVASVTGQGLDVRDAGFVVGTVALGITFARWQRLYQTSRSSIRAVELTAIVRVAVLLGASAVVYGQFTGANGVLGRAVTLTLLTSVLFGLSRSLFHAWLRARRSRGGYIRPVVVIGANGDAARIRDVLQDHVESGFSILGVCGDIQDTRNAGLGSLWCGEVHDAVALVRDGKVTGAIVVASALDSDTLNYVVRAVAEAGGHVHVSSGLHGLASQRIVSEPIAHEPLLHIHPTQLNPRQAATKRVVDIVMSSTLLVLTAPLVLTAIALIRISDRGPALFRQVRIGRDDQPFDVLKLRTMEVDAERKMDALARDNLRCGPLFKVDHDPRVTRIGRFLRATSIDELPQLWNVLRGDMSLVGPRPALPSEVEQFPAELSKRTKVLPGITGLWQVEARDNPSFDAYARLDLFYVENWNLAFDLVILVATVESEVARFLANVFLRRESHGDPAIPSKDQDQPVHDEPAERVDGSISGLIPANDARGPNQVRSAFVD